MSEIELVLLWIMILVTWLSLLAVTIRYLDVVIKKKERGVSFLDILRINGGDDDKPKTAMKSS